MKIKNILYCSIMGAGLLLSLNTERLYSENNNKSSIELSPADSTNSLNSLKFQLDMLYKDKNLSKSNYGIYVYSLDRKKTVYAYNSQKLLVPASTTKLYTSFAALNELGPDYNVKTSVYTDAAKIGTELNGNIYIFGRGDCLLSISDIESLAEKIANLGIKTINGSVLADDSYFDKNTNRFKYSGDADEVQAVAPITSLGIDKNQARIIVSSGSIPGKALNVQIIPQSPAFSVTVLGKVGGASRKPSKKSKKRKSRSSNDIYYKNDDLAETLDYQSAGDIRGLMPVSSLAASVRVRTQMLENGKQNFVISGNLSPNRTYSYSYNINNPALVIAGALLDRLKALGIKVKGGYACKTMRESAPEAKITTLAEFQRPLYEFLKLVNKNSDNFIAEHIFKMVGAHYGSHSNCMDGYKKVLFKLMDSLNINCEQCQINDGSGLSRRNRVSPESMVNILELAQIKKFGRYLDSTMSIAGVDGTLRRRMTGTAAQGVLRAKTGTHSNVSALAGYTKTLDGENFIFSIMFNGGSLGAYKDIENKTGILLSNFRYTK